MAESELMKKLSLRQKQIDAYEQEQTASAQEQTAQTLPEGTFVAPVVHINKSPQRTEPQKISPTNKENTVATGITALDLLTPKPRGQFGHYEIPRMSVTAKSPSQSSQSSTVDTNASTTSTAESELQQRLARQQAINDGASVPHNVYRGNIYAEFNEFTRKQIKKLQDTFNKWDSRQSGHMCLEDLKRLMESLGAPQTHIALKGLMKEVDEDKDGAISLREFLLIFRKVAAGELQLDNGLEELALLGSIDVTKEGVIGARDFFEAKIHHLTKPSAFEAEMRAEIEERKKAQEEADSRKRAFKANLANFQSSDV